MKRIPVDKLQLHIAAVIQLSRLSRSVHSQAASCLALGLCWLTCDLALAQPFNSELPTYGQTASGQLQADQFASDQVFEFELVAPQLGLSSRAQLTANQLQVTSADGRVTDYRREPRLDSADRQWLAYASRTARQIIRWPASNSGAMQIASWQEPLVFRTSQMRVQALAAVVGQAAPMRAQQRIANRPASPEPLTPNPLAGGAPQIGVGEVLAELAVSKIFDMVTRGTAGGGNPGAEWLRLAAFDERGLPSVLSRSSRGQLTTVPTSSTSADWWVAPVGDGLVRMQTYERGRIKTLSAAGKGRLTLADVGQNPEQFWRVNRSPNDGRFILENVGYGGQCLSHAAGGQLVLQTINFSLPQLWVPYTVPATVYPPFWRTVNTEVVANTALPPAQLELVNTHKYALVLLLADSRQAAVQELRIEPQSSQVIELDRDTGATIVETVEVRGPGGLWDQRQFVTTIPARAFYDLSVYEEHLQSIAIDATGKSPNPIEDVNYVPKSVGWLLIPSGPELPDYARMDVYPRAKAANNPGAVRRFDPRQFDDPPVETPLERILDKYQSAPRRKF